MQELYQQLFCLLIFIITGIAIGILFDLFRILRKSFKTADWITNIQDVLFWILAGSMILFSIFKFNHGEIRSYIFLGIVFGIFIYMITLSKFIIQYSVIIIYWIKKIVSYPIKIIIKIIKKIIIKPISNIIKWLKKIFSKLAKAKLKNVSNKKVFHEQFQNRKSKKIIKNQ